MQEESPGCTNGQDHATKWHAGMEWCAVSMCYVHTNRKYFQPQSKCTLLREQIMIPVINDIVLKKTFRTAGLVGYVRERGIVPQTHA